MKPKKTLCGLSAVLAILSLASCKKKSTDSTVTSSSVTSSTTSSSSTPQHSHSYGKWEVVKEPTLTSEGTIEKKCTANDDTKTFTLPELNETDYKYEVVTKSTCITKGTGKYTYTKDGQNFEFTVELAIDLDNHEHVNADGVCTDCYNNLGLSYSYNDVNETCTVSSLGFTGTDGVRRYITDVVIPKTVTKDGKTYTVTKLDYQVFKDYKSLKSITIPSGLTTIGQNAFEGCTSLETIKVDQDNSTFKSVSSEGEECNGIFSKDGTILYVGCNNTIIPNGVKTISDKVFYGSSITSITLPVTLTTIGKQAFYGSSLKSIEIPSKVTSIEQNAFNGCTSLETLKVNVNNETYKSTNSEGEECNAILSKNGETLHFGCKTTKIPDGVTSIASYAFLDCSPLTSITLPSSVTSIGDGSFSNCTSLDSVTLSDGLTSIGTQAFSNCKALKSVTIPDGVTKIGKEAFSGTSLTSVTMPDSVTTVETYAFANCSALESVVISNGMTSIAAYMFVNCTSLKSINIPSSVTSIGQYVFSNCTSLESVKVDSNNTKYRSTNSEGEECNAIFSKDCTVLYFGFKTSNIPYYVETIEAYAFSGSPITSIEIKNSVKKIGMNAFSGSALKSVTIPSSVTSIGTEAFSNCLSLETIKVNANNLTYRSTDSNGNECNGIFSKDGNTLHHGFSTTVIPYGVTTIGRKAFSNCSTLKTIKIPDSVVTLSDYAFSDCTSLETIIIPSSVTSIGQNVFNNCKSLKYMVLSPNITSAIKATTFNGLSVTSTNICIDTAYSESISSASKDLFGIDIFTYRSDTKPNDTNHSYWHYDSNNNPVKW